MSEDLYATIGRKQEELDRLNIEYDRLLAVLGLVIIGELKHESVIISIENRSWQIEADEKSPITDDISSSNESIPVTDNDNVVEIKEELQTI